MFHVVITEKHKMSIHSFCSEKINEAVSILGKCDGVTFVSKGLGVERKFEPQRHAQCTRSSAFFYCDCYMQNLIKGPRL